MAKRAHLIVPDDVNRDQQRAAKPDSSAWVSASAGTGKTKVLTDRVLRLLLAGSAPQEILCLTYTKAAAAEMANRVASRLAGWATLPEEAQAGLSSLTADFASLGIVNPTEREFSRARTLFAAMLDCAGGIKIQTIHSFCQSLLARFPLEAGLPPGFNVLDDRDAAELAREVFEDLLADASRQKDADFSAALQSLLRQIGDRQLKKLLTQDAIAKRELFLANNRQSYMRHLADSLGIDVDLQEKDVVRRAVENIPEQQLRELADVAQFSDKSTDRKLAQPIYDYLAQDMQGRIERWEDYLNIFLTDKGTVRQKLPTNDICKASPHFLDLFQDEARRVHMIKSWQAKARLLQVNRDFYTVARGWLDRLEQMKRRQALLDFDDLVRVTRDLLSNDSRAAWILYKLGYEIRHLLVDEAQDTSSAQWEIVRRLTEDFFAGGGAGQAQTLFVVGDEKQSIYSFNGADPEGFNSARYDYAQSAAAADVAWEDVPLSLSFRSTGAVLDLVNEVFADDAVRQGVSHDVFQQSPARSLDSGLVEIWSPLLAQAQEASEDWALPIERKAQITPQIRLAKLIARRIRYWIDNREMLVARGRPIEPGDIMVLVPRRNVFFAQLVRALKEQQVPVAGVDRMIVTEQLAVQDILALLNFLLLPDDDLNLAALLKTPLFAVSEENLFRLCYQRPAGVWQALADKQDYPAFNAIYKYLTDRRNEIDFLRPYELLQKILNEPCPADLAGSARHAIWQRLGPDAMDPLDELVSEALRFEEQHIPTLQHFIAWLTEDETSKKRDLSQATGQVRIMTAHASKGMEAPIVFVVDLPKQPRTDALLDGEVGEVPLFLPFADWAEEVATRRREAEMQAQAEENRRLLYVALTRAEDRLYICGAYPKKMPDNAWHNAVLPAVQKLGVQVEPEAAEQDFGLTEIWRYETAQKIAVAPIIQQQAAARQAVLPAWAVMPIRQPASLSRPFAPSRISEPEVATFSPGGPEAIKRFQRGNLTHALLQYLPNWPVETRHEAAGSYLARNAADLPEELKNSITDEVISILDDRDYAPLFGPGSQAEVPLVGIVGSQPISSRVDRLLVTPDTVQLVDYKTNRPPPLELEKMPEAYAVQMAYYAALLRQIYPSRQLKIGLLWTDGPRLVDLPLNFLQGFLPEGIKLV